MSIHVPHGRRGSAVVSCPAYVPRRVVFIIAQVKRSSASPGGTAEWVVEK